MLYLRAKHVFVLCVCVRASLAADCPYLMPASVPDNLDKTSMSPFSGGKAFGLLKAQQREKLDEINKVNTLIRYFCLNLEAILFHSH